jgi:hypothetical protein
MREVAMNVWNDNLEDAMRDLGSLVDGFPYIAIVSLLSSNPPHSLIISFLLLSHYSLSSHSYQDCEFLKVVVRSIGKSKTSTGYRYQKMHSNVYTLKPIQLGLNLALTMEVR